MYIFLKKHKKIGLKVILPQARKKIRLVKE